MRRAGLAGRAPKRWKKTTIPDPAAAARADAIRRGFTADAARINQRWCGDITCIATWEGWLYLLATVIDIASRRKIRNVASPSYQPCPKRATPATVSASMACAWPMARYRTVHAPGRQARRRVSLGLAVRGPTGALAHRPSLCSTARNYMCGARDAKCVR